MAFTSLEDERTVMLITAVLLSNTRRKDGDLEQSFTDAIKIFEFVRAKIEG